MSKVKQVIVVRQDLLKGIPKGKIWTQVAHAGREFMIRTLRNFIQDGGKLPEIPLFTEAEIAWIKGDRVTLCLGCEDEAALGQIHEAALEAGVRSYLFQDLGYTCFDGPTITAVALGPDYEDRIDAITRNGPVKTKLM